MHAQDLKFLHDISLLKDIAEIPGALESLAENMRERTFDKGSTIIKEGETGTEMFFLIDGHVQVIKSTMGGEKFPVANLKSDYKIFFGEAALLGEDARSATIIAESPCRCFELGRDAFESFSKSHPEWALPIIKRTALVIMDRLRKANKDFVLLYNALVNEVRGT